MTEPEQLLSATVPARLTALSVGAAVLVAAVVSALTAIVEAEAAGAALTGAATAGAAPAPAMARAKNAATRGFLMWGSPLTTRRPEIFRSPAVVSLFCHAHC